MTALPPPVRHEPVDLGPDTDTPDLHRWTQHLDLSPDEPLDYYWLIGEAGVASMWFALLTPILGHSMSDGVMLHSRTKRGGWTHHPGCDWLGECWASHAGRSSVGLSFTLGRHPVVVAHDADDVAPVWQLLAHCYERLRG